MMFSFLFYLHLFLLLFIFSGCENQHGDYIQSYYYNEKFRYYLDQKNFDKAQSALLVAKEKLQDHFELDSNLGIVFNLLTKQSESEKSFDEALKSVQKNYPAESKQKSQALFQVYFNRGVFFQTQSKIEEALRDYQLALDFNPTSKVTKTNIELLIQKQKDDQKKQGEGQGQSKKPEDSKPDGKPENKPDPNDQNQDGKDDDKKNDKPDEKPDDKKESERQKQNRKKNSKYQPRPYQGDQLSEGDVKKILGELSQQDKKIRAQFDKKEKQESGVEGKNEKDW